MTKRILLLVFLSLLLCGCAAPEETTPPETAPDSAVELGISGYFCVTGESETSQQTTDTGTVQVKAFSHKIYDPNGEHLVTLTTALSGWDAEIKTVTPELSEAQSQGLTTSAHLSGDTATVVLYRNQMSVCHFQYRLHADSTWEFLQGGE